MTTATVSTKSLPGIKGGKISKTTIYCVAFVALGLTGASLGPTLPGLAKHTQTLLSEISFGVGAFLSPIVVAQALFMSGDITWAYWVLVLLMVPVAIWLLHPGSPTVWARKEYCCAPSFSRIG